MWISAYTLLVVVHKHKDNIYVLIFWMISLWSRVWESGCRISEQRRTNVTNVALVLFTTFR